MESQLLKSTQALPSGVRVVPLFDFVSKLVFQASIATLFNEAAGEDKELYNAFVTFDKQLPISAAGINVAYMSGPLKARTKLLAGVMKYRDNLCEFMDQRWKHFEESSMPLADAAVLQMIILWASVGNTMPVTFWLFFFLLKDPALFDQARHEIETCLASGSNRREPSQEQLDSMYFLDACISEALRLSSGSLIMRFVQRPTEITLSSGNKYKLRKGDRLGLSPTLIYHDEEVFPEAAKFIPSRWMGGDTPEERMMASCGKKTLYKDGKEIAK